MGPRETELRFQRIHLKATIRDMKEHIACKEADLEDIEEELKQLMAPD